MAVFKVRPSAMPGRQDPIYDQRIRGYATVYGGPDATNHPETAVVIGRGYVLNAGGAAWTAASPARFYVQLDPPRPARWHDSTSWGAGGDHISALNYIGPVAYEFTMAKAFAAGCLAPLRMCFMRRDVGPGILDPLISRAIGTDKDQTDLSKQTFKVEYDEDGTSKQVTASAEVCWAMAQVGYGFIFCGTLQPWISV